MYDVIIIGGGPAGLSAAIYTSRRSLKTLVLTKDIGGQISKTPDVENYPGILKTSGAKLAQTFQQQAQNFGTEIKYEEVREISPKDKQFNIRTINDNYLTKTVILSLGKKPIELNIPGEKQFKGSGVSYCATCDIPFFRDKTVVIVGGGNSALEAAILALSITKKIYLVDIAEKLIAESVLVDKIKNDDKVEILSNSEITKIKGDGVVNSVILSSGKEIQTDGVIIEVGYKVDASLFENLVKTDNKKQIDIDQNQATSVPGIFAAGDLTTSPYKQAVIAAGEGVKAALSVYDYVQKNIH